MGHTLHLLQLLLLELESWRLLRCELLHLFLFGFEVLLIELLDKVLDLLQLLSLLIFESRLRYPSPAGNGHLLY